MKENWIRWWWVQMSDIVKIDKNNIVALLHKNDGLSLPRPFAKEIYLIDTEIAGTTHVYNIKDLDTDLVIGKKLNFFREPNNQYDKKAIVVKDDNGNKIGYIPRAKNEILSRLMDAGKLLYGSIYAKEYVGDWIKITIQVFLDD